MRQTYSVSRLNDLKSSHADAVDKLVQLEQQFFASLAYQMERLERDKILAEKAVADHLAKLWSDTGLHVERVQKSVIENLGRLHDEFRRVEKQILGSPQSLNVSEFVQIPGGMFLDEATKGNSLNIDLLLPFFDQRNIVIMGGSLPSINNLIKWILFDAIQKSELRGFSIHLVNNQMRDFGVFARLQIPGGTEFESCTGRDIDTMLEQLMRVITQNQARSAGFETFGQYLRAHNLEERFHVLCVLDYQDLNAEQQRKVLSIMKEGPARGVTTVLQAHSGSDFYDVLDPSRKIGALVTVKNERAAKYSVTEGIFGGRTYFVPEVPFTDQSAVALFEERRDTETKQSHLHLSDILNSVKLWAKTSGGGIDALIGREGTEIAKFTLGKDVAGVHGNHVLVFGTTGSGKSVALNTIIYSLAHQYSPEEVQFYLLDFKESVEFGVFAEDPFLPHVRFVGMKCDLSMGKEVLTSLQAEMARRAELFQKESNAKKVFEYRERSGKKLPRIVLIVDEFQNMLDETNVLLLQEVVSKGRSFGVHVILATQDLSNASEAHRLGTILNQITVRLALPCSEATSRQLLQKETPDATELERGRAILTENFTSSKNNRRIEVAISDDSARQIRLEMSKVGSVVATRPLVIAPSEFARPVGALGSLYAEILRILDRSASDFLDIRFDSRPEPFLDARERAIAEIGVSYDPAAPPIETEFKNSANSHLVILGREEAREGICVLHSVVLSLAQRHVAPLSFAFLQTSNSADTNLADLEAIVTSLGHNSRRIGDPSELDGYLKEHHDFERRFVVAPNIEGFDFGGLTTSLMRDLRNAARDGTHLIGRWQRVEDAFRFAPELLKEEIPKVLLKVTRQELGDYANRRTWPFVEGRGFFYRDSLETGRWFVHYLSPISPRKHDQT